MRGIVALLSIAVLAPLFLLVPAHSSSAASASPIIEDVNFVQTGPSVLLEVWGEGFGSSPPAPSNVADSGYTGDDYGNALYICDTTPHPTPFCAGQNTGGGGDAIGLLLNPDNGVWVDGTSNLIEFGSSYDQLFYPNNVDRLQTGDAFTLTINGTTCSGTVPASTSPDVTCSKPVFLLAPEINYVGTPQVDQAFTCGHVGYHAAHEFSPDVTSVAYQWQRDGADIPSATADSYRSSPLTPATR